jgi:hypothetical protein
MGTPNDVVVAGTKAFALALFAPLTERTGTRPRIAPEPQQALSMCAGSSGVLVVEYGAAWLATLQQLRHQAPGLRVVAALPRGEEGAALSLAPLGVEAIPWDGQPAPVLLAVTHLLGAAANAAPPPAAPRPAPRPAITPMGGTPAQAALRPATTPFAGTPAQPPPPRLSPSAPSLSRAVATTPPAGTPAQAGPRPPIAPPAPPPPPRAAEQLPDDLFSGLEEAAPAPVAPAPHAVGARPEPLQEAPPPYTGPSSSTAAARPSTDWPANAPSEDEAESALVLYVRGKLRPEAPLAALARQAVASMSELERQVLGGAPLPFDGQPVYRAAVLRLRVAAALASAPTPPARVDDPAVQRLLSEFDALLALVNPLAQVAPPEHLPALEAVRNALVKEAVDFSEVAHRATSTGELPGQAEARAAQGRPGPATRVLSVQAGQDEIEEVETRRGRRVWVALAIAALAAGAFHAYRYWLLDQARQAQRAATLPGGPPGLGLAPRLPGGPVLLVPLPGDQPDPAEVERWKALEEAKGNKVIDRDGSLMVVPAPPPGPPKQ